MSLALKDISQSRNEKQWLREVKRASGPDAKD